MEKEELLKAKEMLVKNAIKKIETGEVSNDLYQIIGSALYDIQKAKSDKEYRKTMAELMSKTITGFGG